mmetsp:Transcript_123250/g.356064  ORF Transcript_123250/g.356064 Transcript_123250/m.356064 type:complete len:248 (-) Transcript_123250:56-799(-)
MGLVINATSSVSSRVELILGQRNICCVSLSRNLGDPVHFSTLSIPTPKFSSTQATKSSSSSSCWPSWSPNPPAPPGDSSSPSSMLDRPTTLDRSTANASNICNVACCAAIFFEPRDKCCTTFFINIWPRRAGGLADGTSIDLPKTCAIEFAAEAFGCAPLRFDCALLPFDGSKSRSIALRWAKLALKTAPKPPSKSWNAGSTRASRINGMTDNARMMSVSSSPLGRGPVRVEQRLISTDRRLRRRRR